LNECKLINDVFGTINNAIKSVTNNVFGNNKESQIIESAILKIFSNMNVNVGDALRRWRDVNKIEKLKDNISQKQKENVLKVLNNILNNGKNLKIRDAIQKFRLNRKIIDIQRNFLKRLLMSKAGLALIAFRKIVSLP